MRKLVLGVANSTPFFLIMMGEALVAKIKIEHSPEKLKIVKLFTS